MSGSIETLGSGIAPIVGGASPKAAGERLIDGPFQDPDPRLVTIDDRGGRMRCLSRAIAVRIFTG